MIDPLSYLHTCISKYLFKFYICWCLFVLGYPNLLVQFSIYCKKHNLSPIFNWHEFWFILKKVTIYQIFFPHTFDVQSFTKPFR